MNLYFRSSRTSRVTTGPNSSQNAQSKSFTPITSPNPSTCTLRNRLFILLTKENHYKHRLDWSRCDALYFSNKILFLLIHFIPALLDVNCSLVYYSLLLASAKRFMYVIETNFLYSFNLILNRKILFLLSWTTYCSLVYCFFL